jgi:hypothetical protein
VLGVEEIWPRDLNIVRGRGGIVVKLRGFTWAFMEVLRLMAATTMEGTSCLLCAKADEMLLADPTSTSSLHQLT